MVYQKYLKGTGFTLIELLVVIAIISLLSSVVLSSLSSARASARDTRRIQDMRNIMTALEIYRNQHGYMPGWGGDCDFSNDGDFGGIAQKFHAPDEHGCMIDEIGSVMSGGAVPTDPIADDEFYYAYDNYHLNTSNQCDGESSVLIGFNASETGIDDRDTTTGGDQNMNEAAYNRIICLD